MKWTNIGTLIGFLIIEFFTIINMIFFVVDANYLPYQVELLRNLFFFGIVNLFGVIISINQIISSNIKNVALNLFIAFLNAFGVSWILILLNVLEISLYNWQAYFTGYIFFISFPIFFIFALNLYSLIKQIEK